MSFSRVIAGAATLVLLAGLPAHAAVVNGNFEDTSLPGAGLVNHNTLANLAAGPGADWDVYRAIPGWYTTDGSGIEVQSNRTLGTIDSHGGGSLYVELDSHPGPRSNSTMQQTVRLGRGAYLLEFYYSPRTGDFDSNGINYLVENDGFSLVMGFVKGPSGGTVVRQWTKVSRLFGIGSKSDVTLSFSAFGKEDTYGGLLDDISLTPVPVPVPAALPMLLAALSGLAFAARRRRCTA